MPEGLPRNFVQINIQILEKRKRKKVKDWKTMCKNVF